MSEASAYATRTLRNRKEFGGMKADVAEIILDNFDTSALLRRLQQEQTEQEGLIDDQPTLQESSRPKPCQSKPAILTPLIQLANPLMFPSFIPPAPLPKPVVFIPDPSKTAKQNKNAKRHSVWRDGRRSVRLIIQEQVGTTLKACAIRKATRTLLDKKMHLTIPKSLTECLEQRKGGSWTGRKVVRNGKTYTLDKVLSLPGMQSIEWDGKETVVIRGSDGGHATTLLKPRPATSLRVTLSRRSGRRSMHIPSIRGFFAMPIVYYPKLERLYANVKDKLRVDNPSLADPLPGCCFSACNLNLGRAVTLRHTDFLNLLFGQCAVLALGDFKYKKGGDLVLWDLGLVIEFPPGAMILLPSALLEHLNVSIAGDERRSSITFYSASGLFRWVTNGYMSDKEFKARASTKMRQQWDQHRVNLWKVGVDLLSK
ncbi:hypothetical protein PM082_009988 [Marasmius tenuissimus]|nr:hypothetical protein PM082_009988 [Marasmius tenuissimus]